MLKLKRDGDGYGSGRLRRKDGKILSACGKT